MGEFLGFRQTGLDNDPNWGKDDLETNVVVRQLVQRSSNEASGVRLCWLFTQAGGVDDNNIIKYSYDVVNGWQVLETEDDITLDAMTTYMSEEVPDFGVFYTVTDEERLAIFDYINGVIT